MSDTKSNCPGGAGLEKELARMPATTSGKSDKADDSKESTQNLLSRQHVTTPNPTICANSTIRANLGVLNQSEAKDGIPEESSDFTKVDVVRSLAYACGLCDVRNCDRASCVEFRKTLEKYKPCCGKWTDLEEWALQLAACICSQKNEDGRDPCKLPAVFTSMDALVDKYRSENSSEDPAEKFAWAHGVELSDVLSVLAWLNGIMSGRYEVIQESNRLQKDNEDDEGGAMEAGQIMEAVDRAKKYKLCRHRVWAVARSLPGSQLNLPALVPPGMDSRVVPHKGHDRCTFDSCEYSRKDFTAQKQRHECEEAKNCKLLSFPQQKLVEPALAGNPTAWKLDGQSIIEPNQPFMAISHVWADGTGAGPWPAGRVNECLFKFFRRIAEHFQCEGIWWDTISIPRDDKKARNEAINNLQSYYIDARITLIHDLYLREWKWVDAESACFAIVMSMWFSRGWTSLELAKSGRAKVLFKPESTGCLIVKDLDEDILAKPGEPSSPWRQVATAAIFNLRRKRIEGLNDILTALGPRDTSWPKDIAIISRLLAGVEVPVHASEQAIYQEILKKMKFVYHGQLFHDSTTMIKEFSWCPPNLFDMPLALNLGSTPLTIQENGDVVGSWRVFGLDAFCWKGYVSLDRHSLIRSRTQLAMRDKKHLFLVEEGSITRALLVKMFRKKEFMKEFWKREEMPPPRRIHCQFVGPVYFSLARTPKPNKDGVKIEVRIGDMEGMDELENEEVAFDYVCEMARGSRAMPNAENKELGQMRPENKNDKKARSILDLLKEPVSQEKYPEIFAWHAAAEKGYVSVVKLLLNDKIIRNLNVQDSMGRTALLLAAANGNDKVVELLLERKADPNVADDYKRTPLQRAAWGGSKAMVKQLLRHGANRRALDKLGQSALHLAAERGEEDVVQILLEKSVVQTVLHRAAWGGSKAVVRLLLEEGFKPDTKDNDGQTALHVAVERGHVSVVHVILEKSSDFANVTNAKGQTALFEAAKNGHKDIVELLLMKGAELKFKDGHSRIALFEAAKNGHKDIVQLLLTKGAERDFKDGRSRTALFEAAKNGHKDIVRLLLMKGAKSYFKDDHSRTALSLAAEHGHKATVVELLLKSSVELDQKDRDNKVPLVYAAAGGHLDIVKLLLDSKSVDDVCFRPGFRLALVEAVKGGHHNVFQLLLDKGTWIGSQGESETLLRLAAGGGHKSLVKLLLGKGVNFNSKDHEGKTPLYYAIYGGHNAVVTQLLLGNDGHFKDDEKRRVLLAISQIHFQFDHWVTLIQQATSCGYYFMAQLLLENHDCEFELYSTLLLQQAAIHGHDVVVELLWWNIRKLPQGQTRMNSIEVADLLYNVARGGHEAVMRLLLRRDFWTLPRNVCNVNSTTKQLHDPAKNEPRNFWNVIRSLFGPLCSGSLSTESEDMSYRSRGSSSLREESERMSYLSSAPPRGEWEGMRYLSTTLRIAGENGKELVMQLLLEEGVDVNSTTNQLDDPTKNEHDKVNTSACPVLHHATMKGHEGVVRILLERGANINYQSVVKSDADSSDVENYWGPTALHIAAEIGHKAIVELLIGEGADLERSFYTKDRPWDRGSTPLHLAAKNGHHKVAKMLIDKGVKINEKRYDGATALHIAAKEGHMVMVRLLIKKGAMVNLWGPRSDTALDWAKLSGHKGIAQLLIESGAKDLK